MNIDAVHSQNAACPTQNGSRPPRGTQAAGGRAGQGFGRAGQTIPSHTRATSSVCPNYQKSSPSGIYLRMSAS